MTNTRRAGGGGSVPLGSDSLCLCPRGTDGGYMSPASSSMMIFFVLIGRRAKFAIYRGAKSDAFLSLCTSGARESGLHTQL